MEPAQTMPINLGTHTDSQDQPSADGWVRIGDVEVRLVIRKADGTVTRENIPNVERIDQYARSFLNALPDATEALSRGNQILFNATTLWQGDNQGKYENQKLHPATKVELGTLPDEAREHFRSQPTNLTFKDVWDHMLQSTQRAATALSQQPTPPATTTAAHSSSPQSSVVPVTVPPAVTPLHSSSMPQSATATIVGASVSLPSGPPQVVSPKVGTVNIGSASASSENLSVEARRVDQHQGSRNDAPSKAGKLSLKQQVANLGHGIANRAKFLLTSRSKTPTPAIANTAKTQELTAAAVAADTQPSSIEASISTAKNAADQAAKSFTRVPTRQQQPLSDSLTSDMYLEVQLATTPSHTAPDRLGVFAKRTPAPVASTKAVSTATPPVKASAAPDVHTIIKNAEEKLQAMQKEALCAQNSATPATPTPLAKPANPGTASPAAQSKPSVVTKPTPRQSESSLPPSASTKPNAAANKPTGLQSLATAAHAPATSKSASSSATPSIPAPPAKPAPNAATTASTRGTTPQATATPLPPAPSVKPVLNAAAEAVTVINPPSTSQAKPDASATAASAPKASTDKILAKLYQNFDNAAAVAIANIQGAQPTNPKTDTAASTSYASANKSVANTRATFPPTPARSTGANTNKSQ